MQTRIAQVGAAALGLPEQTALAAHLEVDLGEREAARVAHQRVEALAPLRRRLGRAVEEAVRLLVAAADPAAQLVQLGEAEAVGVLDDHHGGVRDVDADLDHGRRHEHVDAAGGELGHHALAIRSGHLPVRAGHAHLGERSRGEPRRLLLRGARLDLRVLLDERAHHVRLPPRLDLLDDPAVAVLALGLGDHARLDLLAAGRQLVDDAEVEVAERRERERARNRRGRHVEHVRHRPLALGELGALGDAEAMLLVDDEHAQIGELRVQQRVRADRDQGLPGGDARAAGPALLLGHVTGQVGDLDPKRLEQALGAAQVLEREHLGRRHQRALAALLDGADERGERDDGLARADIALEQPLHRLLRIEVAVDRVERTLLRARERERKRLAETRRQLAGRAERDRAAAIIGLAAMAQQRELQQQELLVGQAATRGLERVAGARLMPRLERVAAQRQAMAQPQFDGHRIGDAVDQVVERLADEAAQHARRDLARRVVHGDQAGAERGPLGVVEHLVAAHRQLRAARADLERAARHQPRARLEGSRQVPLVEPGERQLARVVAQAGLQDAQATTPRGPLRDRADPADHGDLLLAAENRLRDRLLRRQVLEAKRQLVDQVAARLDAERTQRGDALGRAGDRLPERERPRRRAQAGRGGILDSGKGGQHVPHSRESTLGRGSARLGACRAPLQSTGPARSPASDGSCGSPRPSTASCSCWRAGAPARR